MIEIELSEAQKNHLLNELGWKLMKNHTRLDRLQDEFIEVYDDDDQRELTIDHHRVIKDRQKFIIELFEKIQGGDPKAYAGGLSKSEIKKMKQTAEITLTHHKTA